jgi:hypothetical protein
VNQWPPRRKSSGARSDGVVRKGPRAATWLAWSICGLSLVLTVLGLFLLVVSRSPVGAPIYASAPAFDYWLVNAVIAVSFSVVGAVIAPHFPPHNPIGWIFCAVGLLAGMRLFSAEYAIVTLLAEPGSVLGTLPGGCAGVGFLLGVGSAHRPSLVLGAAVPRWSAAFAPLAPFGVEYGSGGRGSDRFGGSLA